MAAVAAERAGGNGDQQSGPLRRELAGPEDPALCRRAFELVRPPLAAALLEVAVRPRQARRVPNPVRDAIDRQSADGPLRPFHVGSDVSQPVGGKLGAPERLSGGKAIA